MKIWLFILGLLPIISYSQSIDDPTLIGDWIRVADKNEISVGYLGIRFENDTLYNIKDGIERIGKYTLSRDTILVENWEQRQFVYEIVKHTSDSLIISTGTIIKYYSRRLEFDSALTFKLIYIELGSAPDDRPVFRTWLENDGRMKFKGLKNCKIKGTKKFVMDKNRLEDIDSIFQWSNINAIDEPIQGKWKDQIMTLRIDYGIDQSKVIKGDYYLMPFRLRGLLWNIFRELRMKELI